IFVRAGVTNNTIGGTAAGAGNVISGNGRGVWISDPGTSGNVVQGNYIGTDATGTAALGNVNDGVRIETGASGNPIGGSAADAGNVISANLGNGISVNFDGNLVQGNFIGTNAAGTAALGNALHGVDVQASFNSILNNTISGNAGDGVGIEPGSVFSDDFNVSHN